MQTVGEIDLGETTTAHVCEHRTSLARLPMIDERSGVSDRLWERMHLILDQTRP